MKETKLYITFYTTAEAMATESVCRENNLSGKLVPVPRVLSAGCGIAWECSPILKPSLLELLEKEDIEPLIETLKELKAVLDNKSKTEEK